ncbi:hypothetical protein ECPA39_2022, partial [Escherichia coli PA39]
MRYFRHLLCSEGA